MSIDGSAEELAARLIAANGRFQKRLRRGYHASRLTPARMSALAHVVAEGKCNVGQLAQAEGVTAPTITRILDGLEGDGFITRTPSAGDRRIVELNATERGRAALAEAQAWQTERLARAVSALGEADRARLAGALDIVERLAG